ncbi:sigma-54-dependent Fis family transcriptional regulator [Bdellovibrio sp. KM01]|uniref:sigma-54 interaction domain-containing protein n=1 Tax=Bdellovibrio sp. KM01 TaxID=2748865 RepID=UPI0015E90E39|nr:sigma-54 dependent transcriptional regulator [Bdellovibrio sp. KM01]QLY26403.1 sigma-54-dependent Fis family transcriptional regulator [Bdellovibrio sp. KM01]
MNQLSSSDFRSHHPLIRDLLRSLPRIASTDANILIQGESGTGKEMLARYIHRLSPRASKPLLAINCSAIPEALLESEFFGHRKGAFTGAVCDHKGIFESVRGGTVFLDEIGDMPFHLQSKLLRVIQERSVRPIGSPFEHKVDFTIIAATHKNLKSEIKNSKFREDLYYRLNVIPMSLPPLRQRHDDIPDLIEGFIKKFSKKYALTEDLSLSENAVSELKSHSWPGNIRELENFIERTIVFNLNKTKIEKVDLPSFEEREDFQQFNYFRNFPTLSDLEENYIRYVLASVNLHQGRAAEILGISRRTISRLLNQKTHDL